MHALHTPNVGSLLGTAKVETLIGPFVLGSRAGGGCVNVGTLKICFERVQNAGQWAVGGGCSVGVGGMVGKRVCGVGLVAALVSEGTDRR